MSFNRIALWFCFDIRIATGGNVAAVWQRHHLF